MNRCIRDFIRAGLAGSIFLTFFGVCIHATAGEPVIQNKGRGLDIMRGRRRKRNVTGLKVYEPEKCYKGYTLFSHLKIDLPLDKKFYPIYLIDMEGNMVWKWYTDMDPILSHLKPDGNLMYINGGALEEIDIQSRPVWRYYGCIDHYFEVMTGERFILDMDEYLDRRTTTCSDCQGPDGRPRIRIVDRKGGTVWNWKGEEHLSQLERFVGSIDRSKRDWANNNACHVIGDNLSGRKDQRFREGNILFSYSECDIIGVIDYPSGEIVWAWGPGDISGQHAPVMLETGRILLFDNGIDRKWSRVIEVDPITESIVWEYKADPMDSFFSRVFSNAQRLPNGNTLICDGSNDRIFEITADGEVVWEFLSPWTGMTGCRGTYQAYRYPPEYVRPLLKRIKGSLKTSSKGGP